MIQASQGVSSSSRGGGRPAVFMLKALPAAMALVFSQPGWAIDGAAGLPQNGVVFSGAATGSVSGNQLTVNQSTTRAVVDWASFNIGAGKAVLFVQPDAASAMFNRVTGDANPSQILGSLSANGTVMLMNPNGVMFGQGAVVNVGSLIATTGNIDVNNFINTGGAQITGAAGSITNQGVITAQNAGLVALVAPSVTNHGSIAAIGGKIALAGSTAATVSLNGGLYEFAIPAGAVGTAVSNAAGASLNAANLLLGVGDAANLLSGVINLEGVQQASSAIVVNGDTVMLRSALDAPGVSGNSNRVDVYNGARIQDAVNIAKTGSPGAGATVDVHGGAYAEQVTLNKANMTLGGHDGAKIVVPEVVGAQQLNGISITANNVTVSGMEIAGPLSVPYLDYLWAAGITRGIAVANGVNNFTISSNNIHDVRNGILIDGRNTGSVTGNRIENTKGAISVQYTDASGITIAGNSQGPIGNDWGLNLHLNGYWNGSTIYANPIAAAPTLSWQQALLELSTSNGGMTVQDQGYTSSNRTQVQVAGGGSAANQGSLLAPLDTIQGGINAVVTGGTVKVAAGSYVENVNITKALTLGGAGMGQTVLKAPSALSGNAVSIEASSVTLSDLSIADSFYGLQLKGTSNNVTVNRVAFDNNSYGVRNGTSVRADNFRMLNSTITGGLVGFQTYNGYQMVGGAPVATGSFANALFENVTVDGPSFKGFYFETADNLTLRNVTVSNSGNYGDPASMRYGSAIDVNLKYAAFGNLTFDNVVVRNSGYSSNDPTRAAVVIKTRGIPEDGAYSAAPASLQAVNIMGGSIEGSSGTGLRIETLSNGTGSSGRTTVTISGGTQFKNNGQDLVVDNNNVDARGAVFVGAADGFAIEDRVTHALDTAGRGLVTWNANNVYVTPSSGSIQRGIDVSSPGYTVNVAAGTYPENVTVNSLYNLLFNASILHSLTLNAGAAGSGIGGKVTADGAGGFLFNAPVRLLGDTTLATNGADITLNGDIQNGGGAARGLRLMAGSGATRGNVHVATGGSESNALGQLEVSANGFSLDGTLWVKGYGVDALGNVALSGHTLRGQDAGAANSLNAGGNVTGSTISLGNVAITSGGDILANISGSTVVVQAQGNLNVVVAASSSASLAGNSVVANVAAPVVAVAAVGDAQISGSSSQITVNAPSGSVSGNFGQVSNTGGGLVNVNGKPQGSQQLSANSENNRVIPTGSALADNAEPDSLSGLQLAQAGGLPGQGDTVIYMSVPGAAGEAIGKGQTVELDLSPRNSQDKE